MTKSIRVSEKIHAMLKVHVAKRKKSIVDFADSALLRAMQLDKVIEKNNKVVHSKNNSSPSLK